MPDPRRLSSPSWLYPIRGLYYFIRHPYFWPLFSGRLLPVTLLSLLVFLFLLFFTYLPQVAFLAIFHGRHLALINALFLVLGETAAIVALLFEAFFADETLVDVFDAVLIDGGFEDLVLTNRVVKPTEDAHNSVKRLGKPFKSAIYSPFSFRQILEFVLLLPLNLIPVGGTPAFLILTGYRAGPLHHWRYFTLLNLSKKERKIFVKKRQMRYTWFGTIALILQLIPVLSMFFLLTTAAGSALWVIELEERRKYVESEAEANTNRYRDDPPGYEAGESRN
ncbi:MAG: hypothetical protein M1834_001373 [Cirrosporium novae-zelandiae]|nr:MAG: hypothetical protein M1834_001373 [Cirrosporium novae-zelandiae]